MKLSHFFLPHPDTHKKAHLLSVQAIAVYLGLFVFLQVLFSFVNTVQPGVLGVASGIDQQELIRLTNIERKNSGLSEVTEDSRLNEAAYKKAQNMFEEDYWAHYSPTGKDPWGFITSAGYRFSYAGENLARNFYNSGDIVKAWMSSPTHKANIVNNHYQNIGIAVVEGTLKGQKTTLIVQEFGTPSEYIAQKPAPTDSPAAIATSELEVLAEKEFVAQENPTLVAGDVARSATIQPTAQAFLMDPFFVMRTLGIIVVGIILSLTLVDLIIIRKRAVVHVGVRHMPHFALMSASAAMLLSATPGSIL